jgi:hypothetical protein
VEVNGSGNALAYNNTDAITAEKCLMVQANGVDYSVYILRRRDRRIDEGLD